MATKKEIEKLAEELWLGGNRSRIARGEWAYAEGKTWETMQAQNYVQAGDWLYVARYILKHFDRKKGE